MSTLEEKPRYFRPQNAEQALQDAIDRWREYQYRIWDQERKRADRWLEFSSITLRIIVLVLAGSVTILSDITTVDRTVVTVVSGIVAITTGIETALKLNDRKIHAETRRAAVLAEYNRQGYEWMVKVELEMDAEKALTEARNLLGMGQKSIDDITSKYVSQSVGDEPKKS